MRRLAKRGGGVVDLLNLWDGATFMPWPQDGSVLPASTGTVGGVAAGSYELGMVFTPTLAVQVLGVTFYRAPGTVGPHTVSLWNATTGVLLASKACGAVPASGWVTTLFDSPVAVPAGTLCCASYWVGSNAWGRTSAFVGLDVGPLHLPARTELAVGKNGVYVASSSAGTVCPYSGASSGYTDCLFVGPVVQARGAAPALAAHKVPAQGAGRASRARTSVRAQWDQPLADTDVTVTTSAGTLIPGTVSYDSAARVTSWTPNSPLPAGVTLTAVAFARNMLGMRRRMSWSFATPSTTVPPSATFYDQYPACTNAGFSSPDFFPLAVWYQTPSINAAAYAAMGINTFLRIGHTATTADVNAVASNGQVIVDGGYNGATSGIPHVSGRVVGNFIYDEPDMAQSHGDPAVVEESNPGTISRSAAVVRAADPTRAVFLNLGKGASIADWNGFQHTTFGRDNSDAVAPRTINDLRAYFSEIDVVSADLYPFTDPYTGANGTPVAYGNTVELVRRVVGDEKPVWNFIETCNAWSDGPNGALYYWRIGYTNPVQQAPGITADATHVFTNCPTPAQIEAAVWSSLIHGARGICYFVHNFNGPGLQAEAGILQTGGTGIPDFTLAKNRIAAVNARVQSYARGLNAPQLDLAGYVTAVTDQGSTAPVDILVRQEGGRTWLFAQLAAKLPNGVPTVTATFTLTSLVTAGTSVTVLDESRSRTTSGSPRVFTDTFTADYQFHAYRIG